MGQVSDYDQMRAEATALPRRQVAFDLAIPIEWFLYNDKDDLNDLIELYIENKWNPRGQGPTWTLEWQSAGYDRCYDGTFLHEFMQYHCGPHEDEYSRTEQFVVKVRVIAKIHRFVFGPTDDGDYIDRVGIFEGSPTELLFGAESAQDGVVDE